MRLLLLEPGQQALAGKADNTATAEDRHRGVLQRPAQDSLLVDLNEISDLQGGEVRRLGSLDLLTGRLARRDLARPLVKESYFAAFEAKHLPDELNTPWRFLGFHLILAMQKHCERDTGVKGHTIFILDNEEGEKMRFTDIILRPPAWSDEYYSRDKKQEQLEPYAETGRAGRWWVEPSDSEGGVLVDVYCCLLDQ